jgi:hypothetical protein
LGINDQLFRSPHSQCSTDVYTRWIFAVSGSGCFIINWLFQMPKAREHLCEVQARLLSFWSCLVTWTTLNGLTNRRRQQPLALPVAIDL